VQRHVVEDVHDFLLALEPDEVALDAVQAQFVDVEQSQGDHVSQFLAAFVVLYGKVEQHTVACHSNPQDLYQSYVTEVTLTSLGSFHHSDFVRLDLLLLQGGSQPPGHVAHREDIGQIIYVHHFVN
jgi:hypothetical protein